MIRQTTRNREFHIGLWRLGVFRGTETDDSRLLAEGFGTRVVGGEIDLRLLGGRVNRYANGQEELVDAAGCVDVEQLSATRTHVRPLVGNVAWTICIRPRAAGGGLIADSDFEDAAYNEEGLILVQMLVQGYTLMGRVFDQHPRGSVSRIGTGGFYSEVVERIPVPLLGR